MIGVSLETKLVITQLPFPEALSESVKQNAKYASMIYTILRGIVERRMSAKSLNGPIGIAQMSGEAAREGAGPSRTSRPVWRRGSRWCPSRRR